MDSLSWFCLFGSVVVLLAVGLDGDLYLDFLIPINDFTPIHADSRQCPLLFLLGRYNAKYNLMN